MTLSNSKTAYGWVAIALHWISAVGVIWLYFLGEAIEHAIGDKLPREQIIAAIRFHVSVGLLFFAFLAARIISHLVQTQPAPHDDAPYLILLGRFVQRLWILMIAIQLLTGPILVWTKPSSLHFFDLVEIPSPLGQIDWLHNAADVLHAFAPNLFWPLLVLHVAGAAKHLFVDRDRTVQRMLWVRKNDPASELESDGTKR